jgi:N-acetylmuramoyl-L-alanine amidase
MQIRNKQTPQIDSKESVSGRVELVMRQAAIWIMMVAALTVEAVATPTVAASTVSSVSSIAPTVSSPSPTEPNSYQNPRLLAVSVPLTAYQSFDSSNGLSDLAEVPIRLPGRTRRTTDSDSRPPAVQRPLEEETFQYRLIVVGSSDFLLRQVRQIVPDAFRTRVDGWQVIQAGLFVERAEAEAVRQKLDRLDAETRLLDVDPITTVGRSSPAQSTSRSTTRSTSSTPTNSSRADFQYRLIVQGSSDSLLQQVRRIIPDAFRTTIFGQRVIQAGLFIERQEAEAIEQALDSIRTEKRILDINDGIAQRSAPQSLPRIQSGKVVVVVDPGHGGRDPGAVGIGGLHEADIVLDIATQVAALIESEGLQAVLTRSDDREVDLAPRVDVSDAVNADLFVSIHANAISMSRPDVNGIETYYYYSTAAARLAETIHNSLLNSTGMNDRGVRQARFYVLTETSMPAVLVEVGFVTGREDAVRLGSAAARSQIAAAIADGILRYVQQRL